MRKLKWVEANIGVKEDSNTKRTVLLEFVAPLVEKTRSKVKSWHFLWESKPWPEVKRIGTTLRLRFYGDENTIDQLRQEIEKNLTELEKSKLEYYLGHCFGKHGDCNKVYEGEANNYGDKGWELVVKMLKFGSEVALELIKNEDKLGRSEEYKKPVKVYADRYVHCFLDQLSTLVNEIDFYLEQAIQRISYATASKMFLEQDLMDLINSVKGKVINKARKRK